MSTAVEPAAYWRIVSFSIVAFDILQTLPREYELYKRQIENRRVSLVCALFVVNRYMGLLSLVTNAIGYFSTDFDLPSCTRFYQIAPTTKLIAAFAAMGIIFIRTWAIAKQSKIVLWILIVITVLTVPFLGISNYINRQAVVGKGGNCTATRKNLSTYNWIPMYYLATLIWDLIVCAIATGHLVWQAQGLSFMAKFTRRVMRQGLLYCIGTAFMNLLVFLSILEVKGLKGFGATVNIAVTMIMASRLVLHTYALEGATSTPSNTENANATWSGSGSRSRSRSRPLNSMAVSHDPLSSATYIQDRDRDSRRYTNSGKPLSPLSPTRLRHAASNNNKRHASSLDRIEMGTVHVTTVRTTDFVVTDKALQEDRDSLSEIGNEKVMPVSPHGQSFMDMPRGKNEKNGSGY